MTELSELQPRRAERERATKETTISASLAIDGTGIVDVSTGLPFFDHMVEQLGRHASFDLTVHAQGDLHVDARGLPGRGAGRQAGHSAFCVDAVAAR
jgi:imidazoleglycerol-phosphate dehydratase